MTKLVCLSDTHLKQYYVDLPDGDILIHAGDFTFRGTIPERIVTIDWLNYVANRYKHVICVMGNHDINMSLSWFNDQKKKENIHLLQDTGIELEGIYFYGSPYTVRFGDWGFGEPDEKLVKRFEHIPKKTQVLITHGPAKTILDVNRDGESCGSKALYNKIKRLPNLKYHIFGHIHEDGGKQEVIENVKFCNVSILDEYYQIKNFPIVLEVSDNK